MTKTKTALGSGVCAAWLLACSSSSSPQTMAPEDASAGGKDSGHKVTVDAGEKKHDAGAPQPDASMAAPDTGSNLPDTGPAQGPDATGSDAGADAKQAADSGADASPVRHVLVTYNGTSDTHHPSTMFAVNLTTKAIDGKVQSTDSEAITDTSNASAPFLMNQTTDVVDRIDPTGWTVDGSWSVPMSGDPYGSDPYAVTVATPSKVYVIRYNTNVVDVLDTTSAADGGAPKSSIDLSSLAQPTGDGVVHAAAAALVGNLVYVALQNLNIDTEVDFMGTYYTLCSGTSTLIAIDTTTDTVSQALPGGKVTLKGYDPLSMVYDASGGRLLFFEAGCHSAPTGDAGAPGPLKQAGVESVTLSSYSADVLLDTSKVAGLGFPASFVYMNEGSAPAAVLGFEYPSAAYKWDPSTNALGDALPNAPDLFDDDGNGNLVGAKVTYSMSGTATTDIVSMSLATGQLKTLQSNVITLGNGYLASVGVWPRAN